MKKSETNRKSVPLRRLVALARPEWRALVVGTTFLVIGSTMGLLYPQAIRVMIDGALSAGLEEIDRAAIAMVGIFAVQSIAVALRYRIFTVAGEKIVTRLRAELYTGIISQEIAFFDSRKTGELTNRLASDTTVLQNTVSLNLSMGLRNLVTVVGGMGLLVWSSPRLTMVMLILVPPVALGAVIVGRRVGRLSRKVQDALAAAGEVATETIAGVRTVRSFSREPNESRRYADAAWSAFDLAKRRATVVALFLGTTSLAAFGSVALVLWFGGRQVAAGEMSVGALTSFILYTLIVALSLSALGDLWADFARAGGASKRVFEIFDREPAMSSDGVRPEVVTGRLTFDDVTFAYPGRPDVTVLDHLSIEVDPGRVIAVVGPSGAGKSTVASLVLRLYDPSQGAVRLDDRDLRELDPSWLRRQLAIVSQEPILFSTSIADNIRYGRDGATEEEIEAAARAANAHGFIVALPDGYETQVGERGVQLSGGQKQRVAIARALLRDPRVLVLDEATSALDAESEYLVQEALGRLMMGRTCVVIAHRLSTVRNAHRVVVIDRGRVVESGNHDELMALDGVYSRLVQRQFVTA